MASTTLVSVSEYLRSSYRPDCDFVDGKLEERNVGEHDHAALQAGLILWFGQHQEEWNIEVLPEQRIQISPTRFRVPDICLVSSALSAAKKAFGVFAAVRVVQKHLFCNNLHLIHIASSSGEVSCKLHDVPCDVLACILACFFLWSFPAWALKSPGSRPKTM